MPTYTRHVTQNLLKLTHLISIKLVRVLDGEAYPSSYSLLEVRFVQRILYEHTQNHKIHKFYFPKEQQQKLQTFGQPRNGCFLTYKAGRKLLQSAVYCSSKLNHRSSCCKCSVLRKGTRRTQGSALDQYQHSTLAKPLTLQRPYFLPLAAELIPKTISTVSFLLSFKKTEVTEYFHCYQILFLMCVNINLWLITHTMEWDIDVVPSWYFRIWRASIHLLLPFLHGIY